MRIGYKVYSIKDFYYPVAKRTGLIEAFTARYGPQVRFRREGETLVRESAYLRQGKKPDGLLTRAQGLWLADLLDEAHQMDLVHGDLNPKNLLVDGDRVHVLDWEPCLKQLQGSRGVLMGTMPWIDLDDQRSKRLTSRTDLLCLHHLLVGSDPTFYQTPSWVTLRDESLGSPRPFSTAFLRILPQ